ncbi:choline-phosphate cytidylyltransferase [Saccharomycopsis crataegensis]|uniref:choline-phosphate cytidylyltransferase n=1 Tax=Saccharomycopsis crataegensis TaxID=43959 RepID=A0AAV5QNE6_9ASCO|nr:choline-phosphate cytidylyltransferase [Saccharomycopsis crataegensis]
MQKQSSKRIVASTPRKSQRMAAKKSKEVLKKQEVPKIDTKVVKKEAPKIEKTTEKQTPKAKVTSRKRRHSDVEKEATKAEAELKKKEKEWDAMLPDQYKKYRPRGYPLNLPEDTKQNFRVYCDGIYDLFHMGHMNQLKQCKEVFPNVTLVVGVPSDEVTWKNKGLTVLSDEQRCESLKHCRWVDEVIPHAPWSVTPEFLVEHKLDFVAHDDIPYASADSDDVYAAVKRMGKFIVTQRTEGISTSDIITKIIRDYDKYLLRNFARGASRHDLNVSWFKKNELEIKKHIDEFRQYWKKTNANLNNASKDLYCEVREYLRYSSSALKKINSNPSLNTFVDSANNNLNSTSSRATSPAAEPLSPATEFAMNYSGNRRSIIDSFKKWMFKRDSFDSEDSDRYSLENSKETSPDSEYSNDDAERPKRKRQKV